VNRGLSLKCLQFDSHDFHILYEMGSQPGGVPHPRQLGSYACVHSGYVAEEVEQEAMVAKIQQEREAHEQGANDDPEPQSDGDARQVFAHGSDDECTT
jgi:hypothetical protein